MKAFASTNLRIQVKRVINITVAWMIISNLLFFSEHTLLTYYRCEPEFYNFPVFFQANLIGSLVAGLLGGTILTLLLERWLRNLPYGLVLLYIFLMYTLVSLIVTFIANSFLYSRQLEVAFFHPDVRAEILNYLSSLDYVKNYILWLIIVLGTIIVLLVNDKYGPGVLQEFLLGRYFRPKREERIFMFLDIRSSTAIAERLGEERYFNFLRDFIHDSTQSIILSEGQVYQYVGDEIVVSWKMHKGLKNANCLRCFFEIQENIRKRGPHYQQQYGMIPEFKAGLHYGRVMTGEIGLVKKEIAFSGDVLNTTSRIQSKCNDFEVDILLSKYLLDKLSLPPHLFDPQKIGDIDLRGKRHKMVLYTL